MNFVLGCPLSQQQTKCSLPNLVVSKANKFHSLWQHLSTGKYLFLETLAVKICQTEVLERRVYFTLSAHCHKEF